MSSSETKLVQSTPFDLPGFTLPLNFMPKNERYEDLALFPNALDTADSERVGYIATLREILMMRIMETITDKPDWDKKVFDEVITNKWRDEILQSGQDVTPRMLDYIIAELKWKAKEYQRTKIITSYDPGVVKSDAAIPPELQQELRNAVKPLEDVPEEEKDYHPRSDQKVVDLVHPSLFCLVYGRTRVLRDKLIGLDDCFDSVGQGEVTKIPDDEEAKLATPGYGLWWRAATYRPYSRKFQWLPCDVKLDADGECRITSYINNLHPQKHRNLYSVIEKILTRTVPLWDVSLAETWHVASRIEYEVEYLDPEPGMDGDEDEATLNQRYEHWEDTRRLVLPEPKKEFVPPEIESADLETKLREKGFQVIVKLANIELTPENPEYEGGSWHIEGQLNERICATAIYYYDSHNITDNKLSFRHRAYGEGFFDVGYAQDDFTFLQLYGFDPEAGRNEHQVTQELGGVSCREGRHLTFPNTLQHCVSAFSLADRTKPGHRKILALFLIDPNRRIISTANVPPQREDWCKERTDTINSILQRKRMPAELSKMVQDSIESPPMTMDEAKAYRLELMDERGLQSAEGNQMFELGEFNLCEH